MYTTDGEAVEMVKKLSAQLYLRNENRVPVERNHTEMVKFITMEDPVYRTVLENIRGCLDETAGLHGM